MRDSMALEHLYGVDKNTNVLIPTDGGRYDVNIPKRIKIPVYWKDELNSKSWLINKRIGILSDPYFSDSPNLAQQE